MKKISAILLAASCMFFITVSAFASEATKTEKKDEAKKEEMKEGEAAPVNSAAPAPAPEAPKK